MKALCIGHATYDTTVPMNGYPTENGKYFLKEKMESSGGGATNAAFLFAKWNVETYFSGVVGYDDCGSFIKKEMEKSGIKTPFLETNYDKKTSTSLIMINNQTHTRTILNIEPEEFHVKKYEYDNTPDIIYLDGYEYSASVTAMNKYKNSLCFLDASAPSKNLQALARDAKYLLCSIEFAQNITGSKIDFNNPVTLLTVYKRLKDRYPNNEIIITLKQQGALYCFNNEVKQMPPLAIAEVDRTGAGDIFRASFAYGIGTGYDIEKSVRIANIAAGLSTGKLGGKDSIPSLSEVIKNYEMRFGPINTPLAPLQNSEQEPESPSINNQNLQQVANEALNTMISENTSMENSTPSQNNSQTPENVG